MKLCVVAVSALAVLLVAGCSGDQSQAQQAPEADNVATSAPEAAENIPENEPVARIASQVEPSVVQVNVSGTTQTPFGEEQQARGLGSGVIYTSDGYILTNNHVVEGADEVTIAFSDGTTEVGEIVGTDPRSDLAVIKVDRNNLPAASFSDDPVTVGQLAVAIGSPSGFESTVTSGVVSGVNRELSPEQTGGRQSPSLVDLIQTDAAISPGSSGGALVERDGDIIGINVAYLPQTQSGALVEGIGFAIPATTATSVADQLIANGEVTTAYIGIYPVDITAQDAEQFDLEGVQNGGAGVAEVEPGSPADEAGLEQEDVIIAVDEQEIEGSGDLFAALRDYAPGDDVELTVVRDGQEENIDITLGEQQDAA